MRKLLSIGILVVQSWAFAAPTPHCTLESKVSLTPAERRTILDFHETLQAIGNETAFFPLPGKTRAQTKEKAFKAAQAKLEVELKLFAKKNGLKGVELGSNVHLRAIKFPTLMDRISAVKSNPEDHTSLDTLVNPLPLNIDPTWAEIAPELHTHAILEVYMEDAMDKRHLFDTMQIQHISGVPGPKTRQGDFQTPEGIFRLGSPNLGSIYFINVGVGYNPKNKLNYGGDIKIHGTGISVGCLDVGNSQATEIAALVDAALDEGKKPDILILPFLLMRDNINEFQFQMNDAIEKKWSEIIHLNEYIDDYAGLFDFWEELREDDMDFRVLVGGAKATRKDLVNWVCSPSLAPVKPGHLLKLDTPDPI